eukprot:3859432-Pleurochrysis_carterae.AAC.3
MLAGWIAIFIRYSLAITHAVDIWCGGSRNGINSFIYIRRRNVLADKATPNMAYLRVNPRLGDTESTLPHY